MSTRVHSHFSKEGVCIDQGWQERQGLLSKRNEIGDPLHTLTEQQLGGIWYNWVHTVRMLTLADSPLAQLTRCLHQRI